MPKCCLFLSKAVSEGSKSCGRRSVRGRAEESAATKEGRQREIVQRKGERALALMGPNDVHPPGFKRP